MPLSFASWICALSRIRRSSIWRSRSPRSGSGVPWRRSWRCAPATASESSVEVITSLFTTATMRSTGTTCAGAAKGTNKASKIKNLFMRSIHLRERQRLPRGRRREPRIGRVGHGIARHVALQELHRLVGADRPDAVELDLEYECRRSRLRRRLDALHDRPEYPASRVVFEAGQAIEQHPVQERVIVASDGVPAGRQRPLRRDVDLADLVAVEAVAQVQHLGGLRPVAHRGVEALDL